MDTIAFKTRSEIIERKMPHLEDKNGKTTIIALDGGYSSIKGVSPERIFTFPAYAKKASASLEIIGKINDNDIMLKNNMTGETWFIGQTAETMMDQTDHESITDTSLYTRYRYTSEVYKVLMSAGMALGLIGTTPGNDVFLQTGLPSKYKKDDSKKLIAALAGDYDVSIKVGQKAWQRVSFNLAEDHISVIQQPQGTLCSIAYVDGEQTKFGTTVMSSNSLILDIGFGTEDTLSIKKGFSSEEDSKTYSDTAMRAVFEAVIKKIQDNYPTEVKIFEFQSCLETGKVTYFDPTEFKSYSIDFADMLEYANNELCEKSIQRLMQEYQNLQNYKYLIVTGGTGESRFEKIKAKLSAIPSLTVLPGNLNTPDLPFSYSNVVGYYMLRYALLARELSKKKE